MIEEEIRAKLLEEVRKDVGTILNKDDDIRVKNIKKKHENKIKNKRMRNKITKTKKH
jgi:hypothetical protein